MFEEERQAEGEIRELKVPKKCFTPFQRKPTQNCACLLYEKLVMQYMKKISRNTMYSFRKYPYPPKARLMEIPRGGGENTIFFFISHKGQYDAKMEFLEGWEGDQAKKTFCGPGMGIFRNFTMYCTCIHFHQYCKALIKVIILLQFTFCPCKAHHDSVFNNQQKDLSLRILQCYRISIKLI